MQEINLQSFRLKSGHVVKQVVKGYGYLSKIGWSLYYNNSFIRELDEYEVNLLEGAANYYHEKGFNDGIDSTKYKSLYAVFIDG